MNFRLVNFHKDFASDNLREAANFMNTKNTASRADFSTRRKRRYFKKHKIPTKVMAVSLAFLMAFSALSANIASIVKLFEVEAAAGDEYYTADLTLYDYFHNKYGNNEGTNWGQNFDTFNNALISSGYAEAGSVSNWCDNYIPLYLGLQYHNYWEESEVPDHGYRYPFIYQDGNRYGSWKYGVLPEAYNYCFAANSEAKSSVAAASQGLVNQELDANGNITQGGNITNGQTKVLPYFSSSFLSSNNVGATYSGKKFRFLKRTSGTYAGYYVFDSENDGIKVTTENGVKKDFEDVNDTYYYTVGPRGGDYEAREDDKSSASDPSYGFFPLGDVAARADKQETNTRNFGFGARFDIEFTMTTDGKTPDGKDMTFNFRGDDDVWVFIDNKLILDIGGAHGKVEGNINFGKATTYVSAFKTDDRFDKANLYNSEGGYRNVYGHVDTTHTTTDVLNKLNSINIYGDPTEKHTLTLFYIERGRIESNCLITFNFELADKLTVSNTVEAEHVNGKLKDQTKAVAAREGIEYWIANRGGKTTTDSPDDDAPSITDPLVEGSTTSDKSTLTYYNSVYNSSTESYDTTQLVNPSYSYTTGSKIRLWCSSNLPSGTTGGANTELKGWNTKANGKGTSYSCGQLITLKDGTELYAQWGQKRTVTFISEGSTVGTVTGADGAVITPPSVTRTGYKLTGWDTSSAASTVVYPANEVTIGTSDMTVYAVWQALPQIQFKESDGSSIITTMYDRAGDLVAVPTATKEGYRLLGWSDQDENDTDRIVNYHVGDSIEMPAVADSPKIVYAVWKVSVDLYNMYKPAVIMAKLGSSSYSVQANIGNSGALVNLTNLSGTNLFYLNRTGTFKWKSNSGHWGMWMKYSQESNQYPRDTGITDYTGDRDGDNLDIKCYSDGGYLYLIDFTDSHKTYRYRVGLDANNKYAIVAASGNNHDTECTNALGNLDSNFNEWYIAYTALYRALQDAKSRLESGSLTETQYESLAANWKSARDVYEANMDTYDYNKVSTFKQKITDLGVSTANFSSMAPAALPNAVSPDGSRSLQSVQPAGETDGQSTDETPDTTDGQSTEETPDGTDRQSTDETPAGTDGQSTDVTPAGTDGQSTEGNEGTPQSGAQGTGAGTGHWKGSATAFGSVEYTNYRLKNTGGKVSVIRQTPNTGKYNLLGGQESTFTMQFARGSQLKVAQTGNSYQFTTADMTTADNTSKPGSKLLGNAAAENGNLSSRYNTSWVLYDNNDPEGVIDSSDSGITNMFTGYDNKLSTTNANKSFEMDFLKGVDATNSQNVELTLAYTNTVIVQDIVVKKQLGPVALAKGTFSSTEFTFSVEYSNVFGATGKDGTEGEAGYVDYDAHQTYTSDGAAQNGDATNGTFKLKAGDSFTIKNVPVYTHFYFTETYPTDGSAWGITTVTVKKGDDGSSDADVSFTENTAKTQGTFTCTVKSQPVEGELTPAAGTNTGLNAGYLVSYQAYQGDSDYTTFTVTNDILNPYLVITKKINELYYGVYDNPADLLPANPLTQTGPTVGGATATAGVDPNGYEAATKAEQTFIFKIDYFDTAANEWKLLTYETISFDSNATKSDGFYTGTKVIKCQNNVKYRVSEVDGWSWKYLQGTPTMTPAAGTGNGVSGKIVTVQTFDPSDSITYKGQSYSNLARAVFTNNKKTDKKEDIEGDTSVAHNSVTIGTETNEPQT